MAFVQTRPIFIHHPVVTQTDIPATANTSRDGTGTITTIYTADSASNGSLVETIKFVATGTTSAGLINLFRKAGGAGTWKFIGQLAVAAATPSATVAAAEAFVTGLDMPLRLNANDTLGAAPTQANAFSALVLGGPLTNSDS
jgi:hypothetical protein